jgi:hypothetical protein
MIPFPRSLALGIGLLTLAAAHAAEIPKPPTNFSQARNQAFRFRSGTDRIAGEGISAADAARNRAVLKTVAQFLAYSLATPPYNGEPVPREDKTSAVYPTVAALMAEAESLTTLNPSAGNQGKLSQEQLEFGAEFGKAIAVEAKVVLDNATRPIETINAVRLMSLAARMPAPDLLDPLLAVVNDPKRTDAEKLYAFQGLRELLEQSDPTLADRHIHGLHRDQPKLGEVAAALTNYITAKRTPRDDKERAVIEFVRRHAVQALARFKEGVLRRPNREVIYRPAWSLARVMELDPNVSPPFTAIEQTEAAIGFCQMKIDADLNLDVAAFTIAKVVVTFTRAANLDAERAGRDGTLPITHWKVLAARLSYALAVWREAAKSLPRDRYPDAVVSLANDAIFVLAPIEKEGPGARPDTARITTWAQNNPPRVWAQMQSATLFKDDPKSVLPFAAPTSTLKTPDAKGGTDPKKGPTPTKKK